MLKLSEREMCSFNSVMFFSYQIVTFMTRKNGVLSRKYLDELSQPEGGEDDYIFI